MTKIVSRPAEGTSIGSGAYTLKVDMEELQLIGALVSITRLGHGSPYRDAAFKLMTSLEDEFGVDFTEDSSDAVDLSVSHVDDCDTILEQFHHSEIVLEV